MCVSSQKWTMANEYQHTETESATAVLTNVDGTRSHCSKHFKGCTDVRSFLTNVRTCTLGREVSRISLTVLDSSSLFFA